MFTCGSAMVCAPRKFRGVYGSVLQSQIGHERVFSVINRSDLTLCILAGGAGRRLGGRAKGLLTADGVTFIEKLLQLRAFCRDALVVSNDPAYDRFGVRRIEDVVPGKGAPGGVVTALLAASTPWILAVACDMPFVTARAVQRLVDAGGAHDVSCYEREPLLAIYRTSLGARWRARLDGNPSLQTLVAEQSPLTLIPDDAATLESINTIDQLAKVKS